MIKKFALITAIFSLITTFIRFALPTELQNAFPKVPFYVFSVILGYWIGSIYEKRAAGNVQRKWAFIISGLLGIGIGWIAYDIFLILLVLIFMRG